MCKYTLILNKINIIYRLLISYWNDVIFTNTVRLKIAYYKLASEYLDINTCA